METGEQRGGGMAPSPRTLEMMREQQADRATRAEPSVFDNAPAAVVTLREALKALHFQYYGQIIDMFDMLAVSERQSEVLRRRGMHLMHEHLDGVSAAMRSILIKGEIPEEFARKMKRQEAGNQEAKNGSTVTAAADNRTGN